NEDHIVAVVEATCRWRQRAGTDGPLFLGRDTHGLSLPAFRTALEVLAANDVDVRVDAADGYTPTPVISHAILAWNRGGTHGKAQADGIVISPSHNPPEDGGFKYNPPHGGPADTDATKWIENRANQLIADRLTGVKRGAFSLALNASTTHRHDYISAYVGDLGNVIDFGPLA